MESASPHLYVFVDWDSTGMSVSISGDGSMFAAGAIQYRADQSLPGYVRVYHLVGDTWIQMGDDLIGEALDDEFGWLVALSRSGSSLAVSAFAGRSSRGSAQVFEYSSSGTWEPLGQVLEGKKAGDRFSLAMDFSEDGTTLAVGSWRKDATTENPNYARVYRLAENRTVWAQLGNDLERLDPQLGGLTISYGLALSLSDDGNTLASGTMHEEIDNAGGNSGAVSLYQFTPAE